MCLLERSYFKSCECHVETKIGINETVKINDNSQSSEVNAKVYKECKKSNDLSNLHYAENYEAFNSQRSQVSTGLSTTCSDTSDDCAAIAKVEVDLADFENGGGQYQVKEKSLCKDCGRKRVQRHNTVLGRGKPFMKFVWNKHMLKDVDKIVHSDWLLHITHGFIGQCSIFL